MLLLRASAVTHRKDLEKISSQLVISIGKSWKRRVKEAIQSRIDSNRHMDQVKIKMYGVEPLTCRGEEAPDCYLPSRIRLPIWLLGQPTFHLVEGQPPPRKGVYCSNETTNEFILWSTKRHVQVRKCDVSTAFPISDLLPLEIRSMYLHGSTLLLVYHKCYLLVPMAANIN